MLKYEFNEVINIVFGDKALLSNNICRINGNNYAIFYNNIAVIKSDIEFTKKNNKGYHNTCSTRINSVDNFIEYLLEIKKEITNSKTEMTKEDVLFKMYNNLSSTIKDYDKEYIRLDYSNKTETINELLNQFDKKLDPFENKILEKKEYLEFIDINANMENVDKYSFEIRNKKTDSVVSIRHNTSDKLYSIKTKINENTTIYLRHLLSYKYGNNISLIETMDDDTFISLNYNLSNNQITKKDNNTEMANYVSLGFIEEELELINSIINEKIYNFKQNNVDKKLTKHI